MQKKRQKDRDPPFIFINLIFNQGQTSQNSKSICRVVRIRKQRITLLQCSIKPLLQYISIGNWPTYMTNDLKLYWERNKRRPNIDQKRTQNTALSAVILWSQLVYLFPYIDRGQICNNYVKCMDIIHNFMMKAYFEAENRRNLKVILV